ncbi:MAG: cell division protein FtsK/SpoIIIE, partial [Mycobacterium sp.]|nr:cell division protein FtsK/SpoIIIE [Mycobacterium sp.]
MASKTAARSGGKTSRSKATARPTRPAAPRKKAPVRKKAARGTSPGVVGGAGVAVGRASRAAWLMLAKGAGSTARSVGRAHDIEPGHRRDGIALALLGVAVIVAASSWFDAARPVGAWIDGALRVLVGAAVVTVPVLIAVIAVLLMRTEPNPDTRPRLILGSLMIGLPVLGLWHMWAGAPTAPVDRQQAAGFAGFAIGGPLSDGLTVWIATPLLIMGVLFGLLLLTGTTIREVPATLQAMFGTRFDRDDDYDDDDDEYDDRVDAAAGDDFSDGYYDDPAVYDGDEPQAWPSGTPMDNYPVEEPDAAPLDPPVVAPTP